MKCNQWTLALATAGVISLSSALQAEEAAAPSQVMTALSSTTLSGYVDTSAIWKFGSGNVNMPGRSYDGANKQDGFNLNVVKLSLEKPLDEGQWSAGYKTDLLFGPDASTFGTSSTGVASDFALKQAYVVVRAPVGNGLDIKMGVWDTIIGYEVFDSGNNPNYSRSYGYFLEPTTYTGVLASYKINDMLSVSAGIADPGAAARINQRNPSVESIKSYMGSVVFTAPESFGPMKGASLYAGIIDHGHTSSIQSTANPFATDVVNFYTGATIPTPWEALAFGVAYDYRGSSHRGTAVHSTYANAIGVYASYKVTDKMKVNLRGEYASGSPGTFASFTPTGIGLDSDANGGHHSEKFFGLTATVDYSLWANVLSRLEFRWDHDANGGFGAFGGKSDGDITEAAVGAPDTQKNAVSLAFNLIYKF